MNIRQWFRNWREARAEHKERYKVAHWWHISNARNDFKFDHFSRYDDALDELRSRIPGAVVVHVDWELHVIFFKSATR